MQNCYDMAFTDVGLGLRSYKSGISAATMIIATLSFTINIVGSFAIFNTDDKNDTDVSLGYLMFVDPVYRYILNKLKTSNFH